MTPWQGGYKYFSAAEMECKCGCGGLPSHELMVFLMDMREEAQFSFPISSGYRCPEYNQQVSSSGPDGPHTQAAADIKVYGERAREVVKLAIKYGAEGIGISQKGIMKSRFIHVDKAVIPARGGQKAFWSY